jgi:lantibiotic biosynthesis protein
MSAAAADPHRLGDGAVGAALVKVERARRGGAGWNDAHRAIGTVLAAHPVEAGASRIGLFRDAPAVALLLHRAADARYSATLAQLDAAIDAATALRLARAHQRTDSGMPATFSEYDLISGLTGLGLYQMIRRGGTGCLLADVLHYLVVLTNPINVNGCQLPGWWSRTGPNGVASPDYPGGHANLGLAHGVAGPLALMSAAMICGIEVAGQRDAIGQVCAYLDACRQHDATATWWPETITHASHDRNAPERDGPGRASWCYGVPGIARAQQLAGRAIGDPDRQRLAEDAMAACLTDIRQVDQVTDLGICHGLTGLWHTARRIAADGPEPERWTARIHKSLKRRLADHLDQHGFPGPAGLLEGSAGLELIDHAELTGPAPAGDWDACLLLTIPFHPSQTTTGSARR